MHFNPLTPDNDPTNPFFHPLNEEVKTIDKKKAKDIYDKLKKGSEVEVDFGNAITRGGKPITLKVTSGHRVVGASKVGRIILVDKANPRGMKYKLFDRDGSVSLAQSDMGTILRDMKIVKEGVEELDESRDDFDYLDAQAASEDRAIAGKKFMDALKKAGIKAEYVRSSGTMRVAKKDLRKAQGIGKKLKVDRDGVRMDVLREDVQLDEMYGTKIKVVVKGDENVYERMTRALMYARLPGYEGASFSKSKGMTTYAFDAKKHTPAVRKKFAKIIQTHNGDFVQSIEEGFASDAQRRAAFASGYKAKGKKKKKSEEEFSKTQLSSLKKEYDKINNINPESPTYKKLKDKIRKMDTKMLQQVYDAKIKFMRGLAFNELSRRGKQPKV